MSSFDFCAHLDEIVRLNPTDLYYNKYVFIPWAMFYSYDISVTKLKYALHKIALEYPVLCGRLVSNPTTRMHVELKKGTGFRFTDVKSEMTLPEAISESRVFNQVAKFPSYPALPHSLEDLNIFEVLDRDAPVFRVKLVHYKDGACSLAVTIHHAIADAQRLANLIVDISRAYRGESLHEIDHDRSRLWPDTFLKSIDLGLSPQTFRRECRTNDDTPEPWSLEGETYSIESIYFPKADIEFLKQEITSKSESQIEYISKVDILSATIWMLFLELENMKTRKVKIVRTEADLEISGTILGFPMDLTSNKSTLIPQNYFGNGFIWVHVEYPKTDKNQSRSRDLFSTLTEASMAIRKQVLTHRCPKIHAKKALDFYRMLNASVNGVRLSCAVTSYYRMPFSAMDFAQGPPIFNYAMQSSPYWPFGSSITPGAAPGDIIVNLPILNQDEQTAINSSVLKTLFPGAKFLSQMNPIELTKTLFLHTNP